MFEKMDRLNGWRNVEPLKTVSVYKRSKFYTWCAKNIPYWPIPFITKRERVGLRSYFRYHWSWKVNKGLTETLMKYYAEPVDMSKVKVDMDGFDYWEVMVNEIKRSEDFVGKLKKEE